MPFFHRNGHPRPYGNYIVKFPLVSRGIKTYKRTLESNGSPLAIPFSQYNIHFLQYRILHVPTIQHNIFHA